MVKAIVYKSNTGHTLRYAEMLAKNLKVPFYNLNQAKKNLNYTDEIIYLGWICASQISGLSKIKKICNLKIVVGVGAYPKSNQYIKDLKKANNIKEPFFYLRGGIDYSKLKGIKKQIVKLVGKTVDKQDKEMVDLFTNGKDYVDEANLSEIINYFKSN